jgi:GUN4-like
MINSSDPIDAISEAYTRLEDSLKEGRWEVADRATYRLMMAILGKSEMTIITSLDMANFPCDNLWAIDRLWLEHSNEKFGFSIQHRIWLECGAPMDYGDQWKSFGDRVGWRSLIEDDCRNYQGHQLDHWLGCHDMKNDLAISPLGELPGVLSPFAFGVWRGVGAFHLLARLAVCESISVS